MRYISLLLLCLLLQACTRTQLGIGETLKTAFTGVDDVTMTDERIQSSPYASMYLRVDNGQRIFVVLGYDENGQQKWITQDQSMLITRYGRVIKTLGFYDNLLDINNLQQDPLVKGLALTEGSRWTRTLSWTENQKLRSGTAISLFFRDRDQVLNLAGQHIACRVYHEKVEMTATGKSWENTFWMDASNGQIRQTMQTEGAGSFPIETTILKPAKL